MGNLVSLDERQQRRTLLFNVVDLPRNGRMGADLGVDLKAARDGRGVDARQKGDRDETTNGWAIRQGQRVQQICR